MFNSFIKSFAVMITGVFALGFLVTTATTTPVSAQMSKQAQIAFQDNTTTKNLTACVNNQFANSGSGLYTATPGSVTVKIFYGDIKGAKTCDSADLEKAKVFEITKDIVALQTLEINASGTAELTTVKEVFKPTLISTTPLAGFFDDNTVSWKALENSNVKYKDAVCMGNFLIKEDAPGSRKASVIHGNRTFTYDFTKNGDSFCTPTFSTPDTKLTLDIKCGCKGSNLFELGVETVKNITAQTSTLTFTTKLTDAPVIPDVPKPPTPPTPPVAPKPPVVPVTPTPPVTPVVPVTPVTPIVPVVTTPVTPVVAVATPTPPVALVQAQTATVRSGGNAASMLIAPALLAIASLGYFVTKTNKLKLN